MTRDTTITLAMLLVLGCGGGSKTTEGDADTVVDTELDTTTDTGTDPADDPASDPVSDPSGDDAVLTDISVTDAAGDVAGDVLPDGAVMGTVGDPCETDLQCMGVPGMETCITVVPFGPGGYIEFPGGYCSADCVTDGDCGEGALCVSTMGGMSACFLTCEDGSDCREDEGYECRARHSDPQTFCMPPRPARPDATTDALEDPIVTDVVTDVPGEG